MINFLCISKNKNKIVYLKIEPEYKTYFKYFFI